MELILKINDTFIEDLMEKTGISSTTQLTMEAFTLLKWAILEVAKGRVVVTKNDDGSDEKEVIMDTLKKTKEKANQ